MNPPLWHQLGQLNQLPLFRNQPVPLGGMDAATFVRDYWHKKPLLIRQAIPDFQAFFSPEDALAALADEFAETRLIRQTPRWSLEHGPVSRKHIPKRSTPAWTCLVQGVDTQHALGHALLNLFRFIPDARLDDLMVSLATDGGGVGPHFDAYDVFLLQAVGTRRWQISAMQDASHDLVANLPLKILRDFQAEDEWLLEPGDMLYLPPHYAHDGVAVGECMTYSIGFRAPNYTELATAMLHFMEDNLDEWDLDAHYADPDLLLTERPAQLPPALIAATLKRLAQVRWDEAMLTECLGCYLTEPKANVYYAANPEMDVAAWSEQARSYGVCLDYATRLMYTDDWLFINGEHFAISEAEGLWLQQLADDKQLSAEDMPQVLAHDALRDALFEWYRQGWLRLNRR